SNLFGEYDNAFFTSAGNFGFDLKEKVSSINWKHLLSSSDFLPWGSDNGASIATILAFEDFTKSEIRPTVNKF
ncbi:MAG TPA: hypothetical protein VN514_01815, partial [Ignavibacteria bacterium]|nr:hypothetical protein [Ignavibacteria bacterium]